jgi:hypothetical protein
MTHFLDEEKPPRWFVFFMAVAITVAVMMALSSCSSSQIANRKLRRADKLIKQAEALGVKRKVDTVYTEKAVFIPGKSTTFYQPIHHYHDTTYIQFKDRIKVVNTLKHDTLFQNIECPDTVIRWKEKTAINEVINCPPQNHLWRTICIVLACVLVVFILVRR